MADKWTKQIELVYQTKMNDQRCRCSFCYIHYSFCYQNYYSVKVDVKIGLMVFDVDLRQFIRITYCICHKYG